MAHVNKGQDSITKLIEKAEEHRTTTKAKLDRLTYSKGAPSTVAQQTLWGTRFDAFCHHTLQHSPKQVPTSEDISRFLLAMVDITHSRYNNAEALSYSWLHHGLVFSIKHCRLNYEDFSISSRGRMRLDAVVANLLQEGKVTKNPFREKQWLGCQIIRRVVNSLLLDALKHGTRSWDVLISKVSSLVLVSALGRSGDVARSTHYDGLVCLCYKDITIKVNDLDASSLLVAQFEMRQDKGNKQFSNLNNRRVTIYSQTDPQLNVMDPIKWVLILAMRYSVVEGTRIEDLVEGAKRRRDKTIIWTNPSSPVLLAFKPNLVGIIPDKSAQVKQILQSIKLGCELAGILTPIVAHDIRRGTARDVAHLKTPVSSNTAGVAAVLGHDHRTEQRGVTKDYIGSLKEDVWSARLAQPATKDPFELQPINDSFKRRRKTTHTDILEACETGGFDFNTRKGKDQARESIREKDKQVFLRKSELVSSKQILSKVHEGTSPAAGAALSSRLAAEINIHGSIITSTSSHATRKRKISVASDQAYAEESATDDDRPFEPNTDISLSDIDKPPVDDSLIDPVLLEMADIIHGASEQSNTKDIEALVDPLNDDQQARAIEGPELLLQQAPLDFITMFAKINVVRFQQSTDNLVRGGSRDEPSRWKVTCDNAQFGCDQTFERDAALQQHMMSCKSTSAEAHQAAKGYESTVRTKKFVCEECGACCSTKGALKTHMNSHDSEWIPKRCDKDDCTSKTVFQNANTYNTHQSSFHNNWTPRACPHEDCRDKTKVHNSRGGFKSHLQTHGLRGKQITDLLPKNPSWGTWVPILCRFDPCKSEVYWKTRKDYRGHLYESHKVKNTGPYMPF
ncbi:MAG: hypothetical protein M1836_006061 [Candelina mexicana]|nr:MAG: hypothetical protein M1836_006061 [Candelina mexicana]